MSRAHAQRRRDGTLATAPSPLRDVGVVAIGRNEGERLARCLASVEGRVELVVYVDSGSTDGSVELARRMGCEVVELDPSVPFTAARARNAGVAHLRRRVPAVRYVQFVDGDCELAEGWLERARARLEARADLAVACGRRRERRPEASIYNLLCDVEWDTPVGEASACGGDAMMRLDALAAAGGFDETLIAGEEPELCVRLRRAGYRIERLDAEMTLHDAAITRFSQWWRRTKRAGHAYAEGAARHGRSPERHFVRETRRIWLWGAVVPALAIGGAVPSLGLSLGLFAAYGVSAARAYRAVRRRGRPRGDALPYALFTTLGKFPELVGMIEYHASRARGRRRALIEYK
ncbi:MAG TPA: glycosyltransferase [Sandaracinaceae bacterium]